MSQSPSSEDLRVEAHRRARSSATVTLGQVLAICWRRRLPAAGTAACLLALFVALSYAVTPMYAARGSLAVERGANAMAILAQDDDGRVDFGFLNTERERLLSIPVLQAVVEQGGLSRRPPYDRSGEPSGVLRARIDVTTSRDNWVLAIRLQDEDPQEARRILGLLIDAYKETACRERAVVSATAAVFFKTQVDAARATVDALRGEEDQLRLGRRIISTDPDSNHHVAAADALSRQIMEAEIRMTALQVLRGQVQEVLAIVDAGERRSGCLRIARIRSDPQVAADAQHVGQMEAKSAQMQLQYGPRHPNSIAFQTELGSARRQLDEAIATAVDMLDGDIGSAQGQIVALRAQFDRTKTDLAQYRGDLAMLQALRARIRPNEAVLEQVTRRGIEEDIASQRTTTNISVIDPPRATLEPVNIHRKAVLLVGSALALLVLVVVALLAEACDRLIRGVDDLRAISALPLLGQVPMLQLPAGGARLIEHGGGAEPFRELAATIKLGMRLHDRAPLIVVVPVSPGDGASIVAANLAFAFADGRRRTLIVDADMRRPCAHTTLGVRLGAQPGLSLLLSDPTRDIEVVRTRVADLDLIPAGPLPPSPPALLANDELLQVLEAVRGEYDVVVVDCPPLAVVADARLIIVHADAVLLVCREGATAKTALGIALERLPQARGRLLGLVLNGASKQVDVRAQGYVPDPVLLDHHPPAGTTAATAAVPATGSRRLLVPGPAVAVEPPRQSSAARVEAMRKEESDSLLVIPD